MLDYLAGHNFCVISTVADQSHPEAAFVGFSFNSQFKMIIGTAKDSRKFRNILQNNKIALAIGDFKGTVQYEGIAEAINYGDYENLMKQQGFREMSGTDKYRKDPAQAWLKITPTWIRFTQHGPQDQIEEFTEFKS